MRIDKNSLVKVIIKIYLGIAFFAFIVEIYSEYLFGSSFKNINQIDIILQLFLITFTALLFPLLYTGPFFPIIVALYLGKRAYDNKLKKSRSIQKSNNDTYYREILKEYSPAEISYINDYNTEIKKDIIATILDLKLKKKIDIRNNKIEVTDENMDNITKHNEKFIFEKILKKEKILENENEFKKMLENDLIDSGLIYKAAIYGSKDIGKILVKKVIMFVLIVFLIFVSYILPEELSEVIKIIYSLIVFTLLLILLITVPYIIFQIGAYIWFSKKESNFRTARGNELYEKIVGLKAYLKDYSELDNKEIEHIELWDDYYIYSVLFEQNKGIYEELKNCEGLEELKKQY